MENKTYVGKFTQSLAKLVRWDNNDRTTKVQRIVRTDVGDGSDAYIEEEQIYSWQEVSMIWNRACLWFFFFLTFFSTLIFMTLLAAGGEIQDVR